MRGLVSALLLVSLWFVADTGFAQPTTDARDYEGSFFLPDRSRTLLFWNYLRHQSTQTKRNLTVNSATFRGTYVLKYGNWVATPFDAFISVADADLRLYTNPAAPLAGPTSAEPIGPVATGSARSTGFTDLQYLPGVIYHFVQNAQDYTHSYVGANLYITAPTGNYSSSRLVNLGENRWTLKPQIAVGQRFLKAFTFDFVANIAFHFKNDNFRIPGQPGTQTLKQDPNYNCEFHLAADIHPTMYVSATYYLQFLGKSYLDLPTDPEVEEKSTVHTMRFSWGIHVEKQTLILLQLQQDLKATGGESNARFFGARISHYFF